MSGRWAIYTEEVDCRDCYRCIAACPATSIRVKGGSASVVPSSCVACGACVVECPKGAQRIRSDVDRVAELLKSQQRVVVSLSSAWHGEFQGYTMNQVVRAIQALGFSEVSEQAHGAWRMTKAAVAAGLKAKNGVHILPACPATTELIRKKWPYWAENILPVATPLIAHARWLKATLGDDIHVVGIGPCSAQKLEADTSKGMVDLVLTFGELHQWMLDRFVHPSHFPSEGEPTVVPWAATHGERCAISGGMLRDTMASWPADDGTEFLAFSGLRSMRDAMRGLESWRKESKLVLELMACDGGCINGPSSTRSRSLALRKLDVLRQAEAKRHSALPPHHVEVDLSQVYTPKGETYCRLYQHEMVARELRRVGKYTATDEVNCGCCGYRSCQSFGIALCQGLAEPDMCVSYQRTVAEEKFGVLLNHMPSGVVLVNRQLRILEANWPLASMLGQAVELSYDQTPGLRGLSAGDLIPFHSLLADVLETGARMQEEEVDLGSRLLRVSCFSVQPKQVVCAIVRNMYDGDVRSDEVVRRTEALIRENLSTVQKIAYLLGENASNTEMELQGILRAFGGRRDGQ